MIFIGTVAFHFRISQQPIPLIRREVRLHMIR